jgi:Ca2+-binding EF-hand superfamily protein
MKRFVIFFVVVLVLFYPDVVKTKWVMAQEQRFDRRERGDRSERPSRMLGGDSSRPPWAGGNPGGERERSGQNEAERNERSLGMLRAMDSNGNGKLEQNEIPEYRRGFVSMIVTRMGGDPNKTIDLAELTRKSTTSTRSPRSSSLPPSGSGSAAPATLATPLATDPLVPYFGEHEEPQTAVLAFGQRESQAKTAVAATTNSTVPINQADRILRLAREIMNKYDNNKNGTLDKDKNEWVGSLPFNTNTADKNRDGRISMTELLDTRGGKANVTPGAAVVSTKQSTAYDRLPIGMPDWFFERDKNQDGQLSMTEYANGQSWTELVADEFRLFLDKNNDGVATASEILDALKRVDEEKRLKEEQVKRDVERRKGVTTTASSSVAASPPQPNGQPAVPPSSATPPSATPQTGTPVEGNTLPPPNTPSSSNIPSSSPPSEASPNWRPTGAAPATTPNTVPYSSGNTNSSDSERRRTYQRSNSSRSRER